MLKHLAGFFLVILLVCSIFISGCAPGITTGQTTDPSATGTVDVRTQDLMSGIQAAAWSPADQQPDADIIQAIRRLSAGLLNLSAQNEGNVLISPASVFLALAMTVNGAAGETRAAMLSLLAEQGMTVDQVNEAARIWIARLTATGPKTTVSIANSIWFRDDFQPYLPFLQANADYFNAGARKLDFASPDARDVINGWVDRATNGLIETIIDRLDPTTVMVLINTLYFQSDWATPFVKQETVKQPFHTPTGSVDVDFMHRTGPMSYFAGLGATGVALPYDNGQFAYFALLPDGSESPRAWLARQQAASLFQDISGMMAQKANFTVRLALPRYEAAYSDSLVNELTALGMGVAFDPGQADFTLLEAQQSGGLYISEIRHKTYIRVDEKGTEAAAATAVIIDRSAGHADQELVLDRPFLYGIMDLSTGTPLFVGILEDPTDSE